MTYSIAQNLTFIVALENFDGEFKRVKVQAASEWEAMAITQKNGWYPVEVIEAN